MPSQQFSKKLFVPEFKQLVLYTGNVMRTTTTAGSSCWNKKSNGEVKSYRKRANDDTMIIKTKPL